MKRVVFATVFAAVVLGGCAGGSQTGGQPPNAAPASPLGSPFADRAMGVHEIGTPLVLDRTDLNIGTTVQFNRLPNATEVYEAVQLGGVAHIVLSLSHWPTDLDGLQGLTMVPPETDVVVIMGGYPPNRAAVQVWNYINARLRIVAVVPGPPPTPAVVDDLNLLRGLERVIAQMEVPSRWGFERLQRPVSFRKVVQ